MKSFFAKLLECSFKALQFGENNALIDSQKLLKPIHDVSSTMFPDGDARRARHRNNLLGFNLLEVMVALVILAVTFTALLLVQGRATALAMEARNISVATELARLQLMECKREVQKVISSVSDFKLEGDFTELDYPKFKWECHAPRFNMKPPSTTELEGSFKKKAKDSAKDTSASSSISAPFLAMIIDSLGNAVRELVVIIRWTENNTPDELRVVTHVIDVAPMLGLARMLSEGAKTFAPTKKTEEKNDSEAPPNNLKPPNNNFRPDL